MIPHHFSEHTIKLFNPKIRSIENLVKMNRRDLERRLVVLRRHRYGIGPFRHGLDGDQNSISHGILSRDWLLKGNEVFAALTA